MPRSRSMWRVGIIVAVLAGLPALPALTGLGFAPIAQASACGFGVVTSTSSSSSGDWMSLYVTNSHMLIFITPNRDPNHLYENHATGVWWDGSTWDAFNEDGAAMTVGTSFNMSGAEAGTSPTRDVFVQTATTGNVSGNTTVLNDTLANGNPNAIIIVTPNWNPNGVGGTYNNHPIGVYYTGTRWAIFNQDLAATPLGAAFNVMVFPGATGDANNGTSILTASSANTSGSETLVIPQPNAAATLLVTPNWNPVGHARHYLNHNIGVFSNGLAPWPTIFTQDLSTMPLGASFNIYSEYGC